MTKLMTYKELYEKKALPVLKEKIGRKNALSLPKINRIVVASGVGKHAKEGKFLEDVEKGMTMLTGQKPVRTISRKSIAGFKLREGQISGIVVTLRGKRMEDFFQKLVNVVLPRVRDFRGIPVKNIDPYGNMTVGMREAQAFPEIDPQKVETIFGLQITFVTTAKNAMEARILFEALGFPLTESVVEEAKVQGPQKKAKKK